MNSIDVIKPDIIINFDHHNIETPAGVVYVRPESNQVNYEKAILKGVMPYADVIYMANLNGSLFIRDALIIEHNSCQYKFAIFGKEEMSKYKEMVTQFEAHFNESFYKAKIVGAFEAILALNLSAEKLFNTIVPSDKFLYSHGQTIKKINDIFVINYDLPAIIGKYTPDANVFVIVLKSKGDKFELKNISNSITTMIQTTDYGNLLDDNIKQTLMLNEFIRRIYHISRNHFMAMNDMLDFVFLTDCSQIEIEHTPLGKALIESGLTNSQILHLKEYPIKHIIVNGQRKLIYLNDLPDSTSIEETVQIIKSIEGLEFL